MARAVGRLDSAERFLASANLADDEREVVGRPLRRSYQIRARVIAARGRLAFESGQFDTATARAEEALELDSNNGRAH